jgi:hypothetical protein
MYPNTEARLLFNSAAKVVANATARELALSVTSPVGHATPKCARPLIAEPRLRVV